MTEFHRLTEDQPNRTAAGNGQSDTILFSSQIFSCSLLQMVSEHHLDMTQKCNI